MKKFLEKFYLVLIFIFLYAPILTLIVLSFNESRSMGSWSGFTLKWYAAMLQDETMMEALKNTLVIALVSAVTATLIGTLACVAIQKMKPGTRGVILALNQIPLLNADIVTGIALMLTFLAFGISLNMGTVLFSHITFCIPYVILSVMPRMKQVGGYTYEAALDLGASPAYAFWKVILPEIRPGMVSGFLMAFTMSVDDFIISYFVTGRGIKNLSIMVYTMSKRVNPSINAISTLVVVIITIALVLLNVIPMFVKKKEMLSGNRRRKVLVPVAAIVTIALLGGVFYYHGESSARPFKGQTLHIYNWGEYTGENIISDFEEETGAKVVMENFDSNEQMYIKVANGESFDLLVPSDYMIQRLIEEDYLQKLDKSKLDCMDKLADNVKGLPYDPDNEYSVPYFWGTVGIVYDKTKVDLADLEKEGYNIFLDEKYKGDIYLYDSERDSFMMALKALGYSMNTENESEIQEAYDWLVQCVQTMKPEIVTDEIIDNMAQGRKALGLIYSGDAAYVMSENEDMGFYLPTEGTNLWSDAMVIPKNAKNPELAHAFINFASDYEGAYDNSSYVGYTSANKEVMEDLYGEGGEYEGIDAYMPRVGYEKDEVFVYNEDTKKIISNLWSKVKIAASNAK